MSDHTPQSSLIPQSGEDGVQQTRPNLRAEILRGIKAATPVLLGFIPAALVLGAQAAQKGMTTVETPLMTGLNFAGGSEFAAIGLWTSPPHMLLIVAVTLLVNSRHILMGAVFAPFIKHLPKHWLLPVLFIMCDENWALGITDAQKRVKEGKSPALSLPFYLGGGLCVYATWVVCSAIGTIIGPYLGNVEVYGFDMAFPAIFLVLLRGMWPGFKAARPWLVSLIVACAAYLLLPGAWFVACGTVAGLVFAYFLEVKKA